MKAKRRVAVLAVLAVLVPAVWAVVRAADKPGGNAPHPTYATSRDTLRGLQGVNVVVENIPAEAERLGLTCDALQTDTELQLRQYGIKVLSEQESLASPGSPYLYLMVSALGDDTLPLFSVSIEIAFKQTVYLDRNPAIRCTAATWERGSVARISRKRLAEVRDFVKDDVAKFINDYLAVNPKEGNVNEESRTKQEAGEGKP